MKCSRFLQNKQLGEGGKTINTLQMSAQSQHKNLIKMWNF